ncbi:glycosyltransferase [Halomonas sp. E19]|uniref:glycosyltransferase n=1 Tax=Halomonas sp. E19 TaxID=3397247 RepID=UPI004033D7D0
MNIMHVISSAAAGGAEVYVKDISIEMRKRGHRVFIAFLDRAEEAGREQSYEDKFLAELRDNGIEFGFVGARARRNPLKGVAALRKFQRAFKPDLIHSHLYYAAIFSAFLPRVKRVYTHHNIKLRANPILYRFLDRRTHAYVGICNACTSLLKQVATRDVHHIDNAVDAARLVPIENYPDRPLVTLLYVGRLSEQKNLALLLNALSRIDSANYRLLLAGSGPEDAQLRQLASELGIAERLDFLGNVDNVSSLLKEADVFVMSSAWEGLPIAQIEATLTGLPVLVTDVGGCSEIVEKVDNGLVVGVEVEAYADALKKMLNDYSARLRYHRNAINNSEIYTISKSVDKHLDLYHSL